MASPLSKKLRVHSGHRMRLINAPKGYVKQLGELPEGARIVHKGHDVCDFGHLFVRSVAELEDLAPEVVRAVKPDGLLWISYPKKTSGVKTDITRDVGWEVMSAYGLRPVAQIAIDNVWSALRFRPKELVGKR